MRAKALAVGGSHACALLTDGTVRCWGANYSGQLGDGTTTFMSVPVPVKGLSDVTAVAAGDRHTCALRRDGTVWCWGADDLGQLGDVANLEASYRHSPEFVSHPVAISGLGGVTAIAAGEAHILALTTRGALYVWGGFGFPRSVQAPTQLERSGVTRVAAGEQLSCVWTQDRLRCWAPEGPPAWLEPNPLVLTGPEGLDLTHVALGAGRVCGASPEGNLRCWGERVEGDVRQALSHVVVVGLSSRRHTCAVVAGGRVACWGTSNAFGELGDEPRPGLTWSREETGASEVAVSQSSTCVLTRDGRIECWGENSYGQLGDGTTESRAVPAEVRFCAEVGEPIFFDPPPGQPLVALLQRDTCRGTCPKYSVRVYADGTVIYRGDWYVRVRGGRRTRLSQAALDALHNAFRTADFLALEYNCGTYWTDSSNANVFFSDGAQSRLIRDYHGCDGAPRSLRALEDEIDRIVGTQSWVTGGVAPGIGAPVDIGALEADVSLKR